jgi:hypothetical protein
MNKPLSIERVRLNWLIRFLVPDLIKQMEIIMAAHDELKAEAAAEKEQVDARLAELLDRITALEGQVLTAEQIEDIKNDIRNIYVPAA